MRDAYERTNDTRDLPEDVPAGTEPRAGWGRVPEDDLTAALAGLTDRSKLEGPERAEPTIEQIELLVRDFRDAAVEDVGGLHATDVKYATSEGGVHAALKPQEGEYTYERETGEPLRESVDAGQYWTREVVAYRVDRALGLDVVPTTAAITHNDLGPASVQRWVEGGAKVPDGSGFSEVDRQRMGVLDYVIGNTDRHTDNYLADFDGHPAAIDNGLAFPRPGGEPLRSEFIKDITETPIDSIILEGVRSADVDKLARVLSEHGLDDELVSGVRARIEEVASGWVTGRAWERARP